MARTVDRVAHAVRREAFVDVAERLIREKGYEQMSIQNVLDELDASRGAFYHYFGSKAALLEAVVERTVDAAIAAVTPLVDDPALPALDKLEGLFAGIARWKTERTELMLALVRVWLSDENALVRDKTRQGIVAGLAPLLATIIRQGNDEGVFDAASPADAGHVLVSLTLGLNDAAVRMFVARHSEAVSFEAVTRMLAAYEQAFERILGLPSGSLVFFDGAALRQWYE